MNNYVKSYRYRVKGIVISVLSIFIAVLVSSLLFGNKINRISSQLKSYEDSEYNLIYKLNYPLGVDDEYIYAETSIFLYCDHEQVNRIPASVLMQSVNSSYTESVLGYERSLSSNEVIVSENIAEKYGLSVGDSIFGLYPFSGELIGLNVAGISAVNYDFERPDVDNEIGIIILGYNEEYAANFVNKSLCFSNGSLSADISNHAQMLDSVFSKTTNQDFVFRQGVHIYVIEAILVVGALIVSELYFYRGSYPILHRLFLKGMPRRYLKQIPLFEHLMFTMTPTVISIGLRMSVISANSSFVSCLYAMELLLVATYCLLFGLKPFQKTNYHVR